MWRRRTAAFGGQLELNDLSQIVSLSGLFPLLTHTHLEVGVEGVLFRNYEPVDRLSPDYVDDFVGKVFTAQYTNRVAYMGYDIIANIGFQVNDINFKELKEFDVSNSTVFVQVFGGITQERLGGRPTDRRGHN